MTHTSPKQLLTRREAAQWLGVSPQTLAVWASTKRYDLPMIKIGRYVRYRVEDLERWLANHLEGGAA